MSAQKKEQADSLVRLLGCDELQQMEQYGYSYRKALGHARFEHNSTLLVCDTAVWNVNSNIIKAFGNVRIIQNETVLSSDQLDYYIDEDLAKFRGTLVQLQDKQKNTLRTKDLDYNTKDSVATFRNGGAMRDKDGQVIESNVGNYDSKVKTFLFRGCEHVHRFDLCQDRQT
jgi:Organic solvent tolerance protein OstA